MENEGDAGEDQGSGWLEVKKKQRSSSKLSQQKSPAVSFHRTPELAHNTQAATNKRNVDWHTKQNISIQSDSSSSTQCSITERNESHKEILDSVLNSKSSEITQIGESEDEILNESSENLKNSPLGELSESTDIKPSHEEGDETSLPKTKMEKFPSEKVSPVVCNNTIDTPKEDNNSSSCKESEVIDFNETNSSQNLKEINTEQVGNTKQESLDSKLSNNPELDANTTLTLKGEAGESKERFRERLWCFLFENLNRSVDELYLLCELECDMEQIKEAILVLEEAALDFRELKSRVEGFDSTKKVLMSKDGSSMNVKADHRRPHALSWEVRRMTTTPHKAEILSSSLEAFKKIQLEMAKKHAISTAQNLASSSTNKYTNISTEKLTKVTEPDQRKPSTDKQTKDNNNNSNNNTRQGRTTTLVPNHYLYSSSKSKREPLGPITESDKPIPLKRTKDTTENNSTAPWKSMDAWKEKRNWEDILRSPARASSRVSHSPAGGYRKANERARVLHDKLMSPEKKKRAAVDMKREAEEKHARATRIRNQLESERVQRLQKTSEKLNRVSEFQNVRNLKLREVMNERLQRSESRHEAYLAQVVKRAGDESNKVNEVRFITSLNEENKKLILRQKLQDSEMRRAEKLQVIKIKQKEDTLREEAVLERRRLLEAEKLQRLAETQRKKEEAQLRREEERKASSAARELRAVEQLRRKEIRAKAQQEEAENLAQRLAEKLRESEQRRKYYLEQIRERASMDFRDQSNSPLHRRSLNKDGPVKSVLNKICEDCLPNGEVSVRLVNNVGNQQQNVKRRIKKIRQRLMALKHDFVEPFIGGDNNFSLGIAYRAAFSASKAKIGRWLQDLQKLRQARKEGAASIGLIVGDIVKYLEGRELELHATRQAGMLDFVSSALPASHTSKPEACQVTLYLLNLLKTLLSLPTNRSYFLTQNLLPPIIPLLSSSLENYIKVAASSGKTSNENLESVSEILDGFLWTVTVIIGHVSNDEKQIQMQDGLVELIVAYQVIHRLRDLFALYDRPQVEGSPFPSSILFGLNLLAVLTSRPSTEACYNIDWDSCKCNMSKGNSILQKYEDLESQEQQQADLSVEECKGENGESSSGLVNSESTEEKNGVQVSHDSDLKGNEVNLKQSVLLVLSAVAETGLVSLPSLLTAVLLQSNNKLSSDQASIVLPSNFEEVATGVLKVLNNLACSDITLLQYMLARPDLKMEFFHLISFLLTHCTTKWKTANDQVGLLLLESLMLLSYFALFHPGNQAVLRWGKGPTILHKICDLPFAFFSDPQLMPVLAGTLMSACYGCDQNRGVVQQELSTEMLLSVLKSCKQSLIDASLSDTLNTNQQNESSQMLLAPQGEIPIARQTRRITRNLAGKGNVSGNIRLGRVKLTRDGRVLTKSGDDWALKHTFPASEPSVGVLLHRKFPVSFLNKAEVFFSSES
ncbi:hypothetical protein LUZ60_006507 [Juncus effusus]|nr:hypothetical protein LUZ60_006507 [Juncus effusus]